MHDRLKSIGKTKNRKGIIQNRKERKCNERDEVKDDKNENQEEEASQGREITPF